MSVTICNRVFDDKTEISKLISDEYTIVREGITTAEFATSQIKTFTDTYARIDVNQTYGATRLILWCDDEEDNTDEFHIQVFQYVGEGVDVDGDGSGSLSTSAQASLNEGTKLLVATSI